MAKKLLKRILFSGIILILLTFFVFFLSNMIRGNQLDVLLAADTGGTMTDATYEALEHELGLDQPVPVRYWRWLTGFARGDMGRSSQFNRPVSSIIAERLGPTLMLTFTSLLISILISIPLGIMSAYKPYSIWDNIASVITFIGASMPGFMLCLFGIYLFAVKLGWFPTQGMYYTGQPQTVRALLMHLILPATIAGLQMVGSLLKQTRSAVLEVMNEDYIKTARSKGMGEIKVILRHAFRNALIPIVTTISLSVPFLIGGSVVIEQIFSWPGMGSLIISSISARDYEPVMAAAVVICIVVLVSNILLDFVYILIDPRLSKEK